MDKIDCNGLDKDTLYCAAKRLQSAIDELFETIIKEIRIAIYNVKK